MILVFFFVYVPEQFISNVCCRGRQMKITSSCKMYTIFENALVSRMGRLSARFECSHRRGISLFRGILHAVGEGINNEWRRCCAYAYDDYRVLQWKSLAKCPCNGKHRIRFNEATDARSKTRSRANEYFFNPFSRFVVEFTADGLNHFFLSFFYQFHSKVQFSTFILCTLFPFLCDHISSEF